MNAQALMSFFLFNSAGRFLPKVIRRYRGDTLLPDPPDSGNVLLPAPLIGRGSG
jgi:hypothetical protein